MQTCQAMRGCFGNAAARSLFNPSGLRTVDNGQNLFYNGALAGVDFMW